MTKRAFIIHGWEGHPKHGWFPWLKEQLEQKGYTVDVPEMPDPETPKIDAWISFLKERVGTPDEETVLIGHSIGCQTILRYLAGVPTTIAKAILVAGWVNLLPEALEEEGAEDVAREWLDTPINWDIVKDKAAFVALFSTDDPYVPMSDADIFKEKLNAKIIIQEEKEHFSEQKEIPVLLEEFR